MNPVDAILLPFAGVKNPAFGVEIRFPGIHGVLLEVAPGYAHSICFSVV